MTTNEGRLLKKTYWNKKDIENWLGLHMGEYLLKRVDVRSKMENPACDVLTKKTLAEISRRKYEVADPPEDRWILEREAALIATIPPSVTGYSASSEEILDILIKAEPEAQRLIRKISSLRAKKQTKKV